MTYLFSDLMELISEAKIPAFIAEHVFANKNKMADELSKTGHYAFFGPTGDKVEIKLSNLV